MKKPLAVIIVLLLFLALVISFFNYYNDGESLSPLEIKEVCLSGFSEECFGVEIVDDINSRGLGLMYREHLDPRAGMIFIFDESGIYEFWMKNTLLSLDIIWISQNKEIVYIKENALPCGSGFCENINPGLEALWVLEINSGLVDKLGINVGDEVDFR